MAIVLTTPPSLSRQMMLERHDQIPPRQMLLVSWNAAMPIADPSLPIPDSLTPPKGITLFEMAVSLIPTCAVKPCTSTKAPEERAA